MGIFIATLISMVMGFLGFFIGMDKGDDFGVNRTCKEAYAAKVSQQIPTCKAWETEIMGQLEGK